MKKKALTILLAVILIVSFAGIITAAAASVKIKGNSTVVAGSSYSYTITVSGNASTIGGKVSWSGFASGSAELWKDSSSGMSENISASTTIKISVPSGTPVGSTCTIKVSGQYSTFDGTSVGEGSFSDSKTITVVEKTVRSSEPTPTPKPTPTPTPSEWDLAAEKVKGLSDGGTMTVDIAGKDRAIPASLYNTILEKQGIVTLNFGAYTVTLDGTALGALDEDTKELDLELSFDTVSDLSEAVGETDVYQLHFSHEGDFPGKISFTFKAEKNSPGDTVYLYYYRSTAGVIEAVQTAVVDEDGYVTFDVYHCSSYFVSTTLIESAAGIMILPEPEPTPTPTPSPTPTPAPTEEPAQEVAAPTVSAGISPFITAAVGAGAALIAVFVTLLVTGWFRRKPKQ